MIRWQYAKALYNDPDAPLDDIREAVMTLEETERIARRVLGGAHPLVARIEQDLEDSEESRRGSGVSFTLPPPLVLAFAIAVVAWFLRYLTNE